MLVRKFLDNSQSEIQKRDHHYGWNQTYDVQHYENDPLLQKPWRWNDGLSR
jgi:hypothetical protein